MTDTHTHPCLPLILCVYKHTTRGASFIALLGALPLHTHIHTSSCVLEICLVMTHIHTPIPILPLKPMPTLDCLHKHIFLLHVYRSVSLAGTRRYTQLAYLFHQCATSFISRDCRIADCTVRHPGVELLFFSYHCFAQAESESVVISLSNNFIYCFLHPTFICGHVIGYCVNYEVLYIVMTSSPCTLWQ